MLSASKDKKLLENLSNYILMQDGAPAHTENATQLWCREHLKTF